LETRYTASPGATSRCTPPLTEWATTLVSGRRSRNSGRSPRRARTRKTSPTSEASGIKTPTYDCRRRADYRSPFCCAMEFTLPSPPCRLQGQGGTGSLREEGKRCGNDGRVLPQRLGYAHDDDSCAGGSGRAASDVGRGRRGSRADAGADREARLGEGDAV